MKEYFFFPLISVPDAPFKGAQPFTEIFTGAVQMGQYIVRAAPSRHFSGSETRYIFGTFVPENDIPLKIDEINADIQQINDLPVGLQANAFF
jgi:hypothetical protein